MTTTANLSLIVPTVGGDPNQWGGFINTDLGLIDNVFAPAGTGTSVGLNIGVGKTLVLAGTLNASSATAVTLPAATTLGGIAVVTTTAAQTLTNKTIDTPNLTGTVVTGAVIITGSGASGDVAIELGGGRTGSGSAVLDFHAVSGTDFEARILREPGVNGNFIVQNTGGSGGGGVALNTSGTTHLYLNASGNVGIGTTSPVGKLDVVATSSTLNLIASNSAGAAVLSLVSGSGANDVIAFTRNLTIGLASGANAASFSEKMRLTSSGDLLINRTDSLGKLSLTYNSTATQGIAIRASSGTYTGAGVTFYNDASTIVGSIGITATRTTYNTSSDYRLKQDVTPIPSGMPTISALKPVSYSWRNDGSRDEGFIAHELQEVIPLAVTGTKDAVNEEGEIVAQSVDYSKIVVHLVAAVQELSAKVDALSAR